MAKYKGKKPMGVKKAAKEATKRAKEQSPSYLGKSISGNQRVSRSTARTVRRNSEKGKLPLKDKILLSGVLTGGEGVSRPSFKSDEEYKAAKVVQSRRAGETSRTASRAKGIAARQAKVAKARRAKKALGN